MVAVSLALLEAGNSIAAKIAIMAMTTSNSMRVNARRFRAARPSGRRRLASRQVVRILIPKRFALVGWL